MDMAVEPILHRLGYPGNPEFGWVVFMHCNRKADDLSRGQVAERDLSGAVPSFPSSNGVVQFDNADDGRFPGYAAAALRVGRKDRPGELPPGV